MFNCAGYSKCTDVAGAFRLAGEEFASAKPAPSNRYLLVYSDLIAEPPTSSVSTCAKPSNGPTADFPWETLQGVSVTALWLPADQAFKWKKAFEEHGLKGQLTVFSSSESPAVTVKPPEAATVTISDEERAKETARYQSYLYGALKTIGAAAALILIYFLFASMSARRRGRTAQGSTPPRPQILTPAQLRARNATQPLRRN